MKHKLHILVMIAFLGGIIAPACGFMWGGNFSVVEICTAQGYENRIVMNEGSGDAPSHQMQDQCEFCFSTANLTAFLPEAQNLDNAEYAKEKLRVHQYEDILFSRLNTNTSPRGPPVFI